MKKLLVLMAVVFAASIFPVAAFAADNHHDQAWHQHHQQAWQSHERQWREHDREWLAHRHDRRWREEHIRMWGDWYQWHRDNESEVHVNVRLGSDGGPRLDIDYTN